MKFSEICEKIKSGEFSIDPCGHTVNDPKEYILDSYKHTVDHANGAGDGKWDSEKKHPDKDCDKEMREHYQRELDLSYEVGEDADKGAFVYRLESYCFHCGRNLRFSFNGAGLSLNVQYDSARGRYGKFYIAGNCDHADLPALTVEINVSDKLIFANWFPDFKQDAPEGKEYSSEYSLNALRGRLNIAKWKAENQNIAYTQVGSCGSTSIWMNKERNHGYITHGYIEDTPEFLVGYKEIGRTDVSVWRVEMADTAKVNVNLVEEKWKTKGQYADATVVKVPKGKWSLTSHYEVNHPLSELILAEIKLVN